MHYRDLLAVLVFTLAFLLMLSYSNAEDTETYIDDLFSEEEYPSDMDTLEEFIQSYYLLLDSDEYLNQFKFINTDKNRFYGDIKALKSFYEKLLELRSGLRNKVSVFQLGDSHIQSGYFSGTARSSLQKYYGNAGRGLVFPLRLAGTNQPDDYRISSSGGISRINSERGICGYVLAAADGANLELTTNNFYGNDNSFSKLSLITSAPGLKATIKTNVGEAETIDLKLGEYHYSSSSWQNPTRSVSLSLKGDSSRLYALLLENEQPGLQFHSTGINGAGFYNLCDQNLLFQQIGMLNPDLVIISLGTNDAQGNYRNDVFSANLEKFMANLRKSNPFVPVLFTLPPDSNKRGGHNSDLSKVEKAIREYAKDNNCAWWNLSEVMGGSSSVGKWRNQQMASKDLLHYTPKGYMLQGYLFYQAFIKSYKSFSEKPAKRQ